MAARAVRLLIEFEDGLTVEQGFDSLPEPLQADLLRQPFACRPSVDPEEDDFLLLEWEDGWKEVVRVPPGTSEVNRYYVITRPEDVGRLSLKTEGGYPELVEISRRPQSLARIMLADTFALKAARSEREGRKVEQHYEFVQQGDMLTDLRRQLKVLVDEGALEGSDPASLSTEAREMGFGSIATRLGLRPAHCNQDVLDFVARLLSEEGLLGPKGGLKATTGGGQ